MQLKLDYDNQKKRRVTQKSLDGKQIKIFDSVKEASTEFEISSASIVKAINTGYALHDFKWEYTDENKNKQVLTADELKEFVAIPEFPNYLASKNGRIYSRPYKKFLKTINSRGFEEVQLTDNCKRKSFLLHNLIADMFLEQEVGKNLVGHKNGNKSDNRVENLFRCTQCDVNKMGRNKTANKNDENKDIINNNNPIMKTVKQVDAKELTKLSTNIQKNAQKIVQKDKDGKQIAIFDSCSRVYAELGICPNSIMQVCKGKAKTAGGFKWKYLNKHE